MISGRRDITSTWLEMLSHRCRTSFEGRNLRVRGGKTVHEVDWLDGLGGHQYPSPGCHVGVAGFSLDALVPTSDEVNCNRCLRHAQRGRAAHAPIPVRGQLALDFDGFDLAG